LSRAIVAVSPAATAFTWAIGAVADGGGRHAVGHRARRFIALAMPEPVLPVDGEPAAAAGREAGHIAHQRSGSNR
jgi:hypothetical protein